MNIKGTFWGLKTLLGSNSLHKDLNQSIKSGKLRPTVSFENSKRAFVTLENSKYDIEALMSLIFEYAIYLSTKTVDDTYEHVAQIAQEKYISLSPIIITVSIMIQCDLDSKLLFCLSHSWTSNGIGL